MADLTLSKQEVLPRHGAGGLGGLHWALAAGGVLRVCWERVRGGHRDSDPGMTSPPGALKTHSTMETRLRWQALCPLHPQPCDSRQLGLPASCRTRGLRVPKVGPRGKEPQLLKKWVSSSFLLCGVLWGRGWAGRPFRGVRARRSGQ